MGMDIDFYNKAGKDILYLRGHYEFFDLLASDDAEVCDPDSSDFYVSVDMLLMAMKNVEAYMGPAAVSRLNTGKPIPVLDHLAAAVPEKFWSGDPNDMKSNLPHYWTLFAHLLAWAEVDGALVCSWSA